MRPPDPAQLHPVSGQPRVVALKPLLAEFPLIDVGEFTYYDDPEHALDFGTRNVLYHYGPERLVIGKFCSLATNVRFIMNGANHRMNGPSTFPFPIMGGAWAEHADLLADLPQSGDTVVGNDVWVGRDCLIMPGVTIGDGAIIASGSVVTRSVEPYAIVGGNPAMHIRSRFDGATVARLLELRWWEWPIATISHNVRWLMDGDPNQLPRT